MYTVQIFERIRSKNVNTKRIIKGKSNKKSFRILESRQFSDRSLGRERTKVTLLLYLTNGEVTPVRVRVWRRGTRSRSQDVVVCCVDPGRTRDTDAKGLCLLSVWEGGVPVRANCCLTTRTTENPNWWSTSLNVQWFTINLYSHTRKYWYFYTFTLVLPNNDERI